MEHDLDLHIACIRIAPCSRPVAGDADGPQGVAGAPSSELIAILPAVKLCRQRLLLGRQIKNLCDRTQAVDAGQPFASKPSKPAVRDGSVHRPDVPRSSVSANATPRDPKLNYAACEMKVLAGQLIASPPLLTGAFVQLRKPVRADCAAFRSILSDPLTMRYLPSMHKGQAGWSLDEVRARMARQLEHQRQGQGAHFTVVAKAAGNAIGMCGLSAMDLRANAASFGIIIGSAHWRRGYGIECHHLCFGFAFDVLGLERVEMRTSPANAAMCGLLDRAGMRLKSTEPVRSAPDATEISSCLYVVAACDWPVVKSKLDAAMHARTLFRAS